MVDLFSGDLLGLESDRALRLNGYIPVTLNPALMFAIVIELSQAWHKRPENSCRVTTLSGFMEMNFLHTFLHAVFKGPKAPLSRGCVL